LQPKRGGCFGWGGWVQGVQKRSGRERDRVSDYEKAKERKRRGGMKTKEGAEWGGVKNGIDCAWRNFLVQGQKDRATRVARRTRDIRRTAGESM